VGVGVGGCERVSNWRASLTMARGCGWVGVSVGVGAFWGREGGRQREYNTSPPQGEYMDLYIYPRVIWIIKEDLYIHSRVRSC